MPNNGDVQVLLAEFSALRAEILQELSMRWNIFIFQLTTTGVVFSFALTGHSRTGFLLIIPVVAYALGGRLLDSERAVREMGIYIMNELSPRIPGGLKWEEWHRERPLPRPTIAWLSPVTVIFPGISLIALAWVVPYILFSPNTSIVNRWLLGIVWVLSLIITIVSSYAIIKFKAPRLRELRIG